MAIQPLLIPERVYGQPIPVAPDVNDIVDKIDELVAAVNAGLATSNAIVGGPKYVRYTSSQTYGVPAQALTLDRLDPATILPGTTATVINSADNPTVDTGPSKQYVATIVPANTAGSFAVPAYLGAPTSVRVAWQQVVRADSFTALLASELDPGKAAYADLALRPLLLKIVGALGTGTTTITQQAAATSAPAAPKSGIVDDEGDTFSFLPVPVYPSFAQYKVNGLPGVTGAVVLDSQNSYVQGGRIFVKVVGAVAKNGLAVYVASSGNVPDGAVLTNAEAFTGVIAPPVSTTPDAPFPSYDPVTRVLTFSHALGTSELEYNRFGGTFTSYAPIQVDDAAHQAGEWKARVKAYVAGNRNASGTADSPAISVKMQAQPVAPSFSGFDDVANTVSVSHATLPYSELLYDFGGATGLAVPSNSVISVGNAAGQVVAYARATANRPEGLRANSPAFTLTAANTAPTVTLSSPQSGQSLAAGSMAVLNATPQDAENNLAKVEFLDNGVKFAETTVAPHTVQVAVTAGAHNYTARAIDTPGLSNLSNVVSVTGAAATQNVLTPTTADYGRNFGLARLLSTGKTVHASGASLVVNLNGATSVTVTTFSSGAGTLLAQNGASTVGNITPASSPTDYTFSGLDGTTLVLTTGAQQRSYEVGDIGAVEVTKVTFPANFTGSFQAPVRAALDMPMLGDSIENGVGASLPQLKGWTNLFRNGTTRSTAHWAWGSAQGLVQGRQDVWEGTYQSGWTGMKAWLHSILDGQAQQVAWWLYGSNDALGASGGGAGPLADCVAAFTRFLNNFTAEFPNAKLLVLTPLFRVGEGTANQYGWTLQQLRDGMTQAASGRANVTVVDGAKILGAGDLVDSAHPNDVGHQKIFNYLEPILNQVLGNADVLSAPTNLASVAWNDLHYATITSGIIKKTATGSSGQNSWNGGGTAPQTLGTTSGSGEKGRVHIDTSIIPRGSTLWGSVCVGVGMNRPTWSTVDANGKGLVYTTIGPSFYYDDTKFGLIENGAPAPFVTRKWTDYASNPDLDIVVTESKIKFYVAGQLFYTSNTFSFTFPLYVSTILATVADGTYPVSQAKVSYQGVNLLDPPSVPVSWATPYNNGAVSGAVLYQASQPSNAGGLWGGGFNTHEGFTYPTGNQIVTVTAPNQVITRGGTAYQNGSVLGVSNGEQKGDYKTHRHGWYWDNLVVRVFELGVKLYEAPLPAGTPTFAIQFTPTGIAYLLNGSAITLETASTIGLPSGPFWVTASLTTPGDVNGSASNVRNVTLSAPTVTSSGY